MDAVTLSQVLELLKRTGKNTDAAGTTTLFARLAQIAEYTDQLEAFVDALETKLGLNTDTAGTSTVFARLAQIAAYVDTLENQLGTMSDAPVRNGNLHQKVRDIRDSMGAPGDGSLSTGNIFQRISYIQDTLSTSVAKWPTTKRLHVNPADTAGVWQWLFDSGVGTKGKLQTFRFLLSSFKSSDRIDFQIWVDGYLISHVKLSGDSNYPNAVGFSTPEILTRAAGYDTGGGGGYAFYHYGGPHGGLESFSYASNTFHPNILLHLPWNNRIEIKYLITGSISFEEAVIIYEQA
ncbi:hypothetical protein P4S93_09315 [Aneurinibacillus thermoaerophilus]|uniref:hypothetical protein n=1 Tax=Aneurinibacillus thermoaerophilus TaxID=143495 RepID=UPI002E2266BE|nr:hypothetical protein [Aneurinibacillus thermoaerophilus]MED0760977.1 hypothetical protein [Aneurinibacillus thermoaerophilus]